MGGEVASAACEPIDVLDARQWFIEHFTRNDLTFSAAKQENNPLPQNFIQLLLHHLYQYQRTLLNATERYQYLCIIRVLAEVIGDDLSANYVRFVADYLRVVIRFVKGESLQGMQLTPDENFAEEDSIRMRLNILELLREYGKTDESEILNETIDSENSSEELVRLAKLIQAANRLSMLTAGSTQTVIKREIIKSLSIEANDDTDMEADSGVYLGVESGSMEFKQSFVYPPNNGMQAQPHTQANNVMRGVCAFLNSMQGGTLYLGVNDQGYISGLKLDMEYLKTPSMDAYIRYVQDTFKAAFGLDVITHLTITPEYDGQVVAIRVEPYSYGIVELEGKAYIRVNCESRLMNDTVRQQITQRKMMPQRGKMYNLSALMQAKQNSRQVILHGYASNNGGTIRDRIVEAYDVRAEHGLIAAYEESSGVCKIFSIARIGNVEILEKHWCYAAKHKKINVDAFHMSGESPIRVNLRLDLMAKNLLVEEYSTIEPDIIRGKSDDEWFLDTIVFNIAGIARFYVGLANHIDILDAPELEAYVKKYCDECLKF